MKRTRPRLKDLQNLTEGYFKSNAPKVSFKDLADCNGVSVLHHRLIFINRNMSQHVFFQCKNPTGRWESPAWYRGEFYFYVLLHEIGHFIYPAPDSYKNLPLAKWKNDPFEVKADLWAQKEFKKIRRNYIWNCLGITDGKDLYMLR
jgi:hypothetical protein